jgi:hypothetical protein
MEIISNSKKIEEKVMGKKKLQVEKNIDKLLEKRK